MYEFHYVTLEINFTTIQDYYSLIVTVSCIKFKQKMFSKILVKIEKQFILVIIELSQNIMVIQTN